MLRGMARRRRKSVLDSLLELTSVLPWWVGVGLAVVSYLLLHAHAASASAATGYASVFRGLAIAGQYIVPAICLFGAASSAISRHRRRRLFDAGSAGLAGMSWQEFEMLVGEAYRRQGFSVTEVGGELYGVMAARRASGGMVVTGGDFTPDAVEFARGLNIELVDGLPSHVAHRLTAWLPIGSQIAFQGLVAMAGKRADTPLS